MMLTRGVAHTMYQTRYFQMDYAPNVPLASQISANLLFDQYRTRKFRLRRANKEGLEYGVRLKVSRKRLGSLYCPGSSVEPDQLCCRTYVLYRLFKQLYITAYTVIARFVVQEFT